MRRIVVYVALADVMINFMMTALLFATPRRSPGTVGPSAWHVFEYGWEDITESRMVMFYPPNGELGWTYARYRLEPTGTETMYMGVCMPDGLYIIRGGEHTERFLTDEMGTWLQGIRTDDEVMIFVEDDACKDRVEEELEIFGLPGTYTWMERFPTVLVNYYLSNVDDEGYHETE